METTQNEGTLEGAVTTAPVNLSVVLDRSGSMQRIAEDMIGGFQQFIDEQKKTEGDVRISLVQFDSQDPFEVLIDGEDLREAHLDPNAYRPRASTPLLDAVGRMIARIDAGIAERLVLERPKEDQVVLVITDGLENASVEYSLAAIKGLIADRKDAGWTFVFLGADQDSFLEGGRLGFSERNRRDWEKTKAGTAEMWDGVSKATLSYRSKAQYQRMTDADSFFDDKE
jgi:hypothetical protein